MIDTRLDVSVVICAYTEERWCDLLAAVESIQRQSRRPLEIIVVIDNNPRLLKRAREHIPGVVVIENSEQRGLSGARNSGIDKAKGTLIAFLDDDAIAEPAWLERLSNCCKDSRVLGAGGIVEPLWTSKKPSWFPAEFYWVIGCAYQQPPERPEVVRNPYGGCACMQREIFDVVGGFSNSIGRVGARPMGGEETELCIRAKQYWPQKFFLCEPQARIHHRIAPGRARWRYFRSRCYAEGISKAIISRYVGAKDSLASERAYTFKTLPRAVLRGIADGLFHFDPSGFLRSGAIIAGLALTALGYMVGNISWFLLENQRTRVRAGHNFKQLLHPHH
jgi:glucosyl-dolichyl phosphate glucuronosyltransferase